MAVVAVALSGCPRPPPASQFPTAADALGRMKQTYACVNGVQGEAKIDHFGERGRIRGNVLLFAVNPARVRLDVLSPFGQMIYTLSSNGRDFRMLDFGNKQFMHGPASPCNLARLTQVPIPGHALVYLMRGEAPLLLHEPGRAQIAWESGHYKIDIPSTRDARETVLLEVHDDDYDKPFAGQRVRVTAVTVEQRGAVVYSAELRRHEPSRTAPAREDDEGIDDPIPPSGGPCAAEVPRSVHVVVPSSADDVLFQYAKVDLNPPLVEGAFNQSRPDGTRPVYVVCE